MTEPSTGFRAIIPTESTGGPSWKGTYQHASLRRIGSRATTYETEAQALTEAVILLHSIRRILIWVLVIIPILIVAAYIILFAVPLAESDPVTTNPYLQ